MNSNLKPHLAIIGANTVYGLNFVIAKGIMPDFLLPRAIIFLRISGTLALLWMLHSFLPPEKVERRDLHKMALCSVLKTLRPNLNGIYIYLQPLVAAIFAIISGKDTLTVIDLMAAALIMAGVYLITKEKTEERSRIP